MNICELKSVQGKIKTEDLEISFPFKLIKFEENFFRNARQTPYILALISSGYFL